MTKTEAINNLNDLRNEVYNEDSDGHIYAEAIDMAIKALSAEAVTRETILSAKFHPIPYTHITPTDADAESYKRGWNDALDAVADNAPSAEAGPKMTEEVREALMRLTMCAREECDMCKYKDECGFDFQYKISTDNMNTLADALLRSKCGVDAKSAEAEWIPCSERLPSDSGRYLVTYLVLQRHIWVDVIHFGKPSMPNTKVKGKCWYRADDEWGDVVYDNILAWMPLPKPYEGSEDE